MDDQSRANLQDDNIDEPEEYGEDKVSGSTPSVTADDDVTKNVEEVIGNKPEPGKPFSMAEEVEKDELDRRGIDPKDFEED